MFSRATKRSRWRGVLERAGRSCQDGGTGQCFSLGFCTRSSCLVECSGLRDAVFQVVALLWRDFMQNTAGFGGGRFPVLLFNTILVWASVEERFQCALFVIIQTIRGQSPAVCVTSGVCSAHAPLQTP
ncbi:hypothetical protein BaRGS_00018923 [Batillaria attramentaria]|uniref:Uncharacterized protein n=1 Tax=Batillaria attramentaria TaxID=370345 RepID=A0ABD0KS32_9CAEN